MGEPSVQVWRPGRNDTVRGIRPCSAGAGAKSCSSTRHCSPRYLGPLPAAVQAKPPAGARAGAGVQWPGGSLTAGTLAPALPIRPSQQVSIKQPCPAVLTGIEMGQGGIGTSRRVTRDWSLNSLASLHFHACVPPGHHLALTIFFSILDLAQISLLPEQRNSEF